MAGKEPEPVRYYSYEEVAAHLERVYDEYWGLTELSMPHQELIGEVRERLTVQMRDIIKARRQVPGNNIAREGQYITTVSPVNSRVLQDDTQNNTIVKIWQHVDVEQANIDPETASYMVSYHHFREKNQQGVWIYEPKSILSVTLRHPDLEVPVFWSAQGSDKALDEPLTNCFADGITKDLCHATWFSTALAVSRKL